MRCECCDKETTNFFKDADGKWHSVCNKCLSATKEILPHYDDFDDDDVKLMKMTGAQLAKALKRSKKK